MAVKIEKGGWLFIFLIGLALVGYGLYHYNIVDVDQWTGKKTASSGTGGEVVDASKPLVLPVSSTDADPEVRVRVNIWVGCVGGLVANGVNHQPVGPFFANLLTNASIPDLWGSLLKCTLFGAIIAVVCCYKGMTASGGAAGVGRAVNQAVVISTLGVFAFNYVFTQTLLATHPEILNIK